VHLQFAKVLWWMTSLVLPFAVKRTCPPIFVAKISLSGEATATSPVEDAACGEAGKPLQSQSLGIRLFILY